MKDKAVFQDHILKIFHVLLSCIYDTFLCHRLCEFSSDCIVESDCEFVFGY